MSRHGSNRTVHSDDIIRTAAKLFAAKGYHGAKLNEIAQELGISKPALYYHVGNKETIFREIVNQVMKPMDIAISVGKSSLSPRERIEKIIMAMVKFNAEHRETALLGIEEAKTLPPKSQRALRHRQKEIEQILQQNLREGMEQGDFDVDDVRMVSFAILAAANWVYRWYRPNGYLTPEEIANQLTHILEYGFMKR
jgi:AcrR family transcriptional regulator